MLFCAVNSAPKVPLNNASILLFLDAASFVLLNDKIGLFNFLIGIFSIYLIVVTNHDVLVFFCLLNLPLRIFARYIPFSSS